MNNRPLNSLLAEYEQGTAQYRALFDGLTAGLLDALEDAADADAPTALVGQRLAALADWQRQLRTLSTAAAGAPVLQPYLTAEQAALEAAHGRTNAAFVGWYFSGWAVMPADHAGETGR